MRIKPLGIIFGLATCLCLIFGSVAPLFAQDMSSEQRTEELQRQDKALIERIEKEKKPAPIEEQKPPQAPVPESAEQVLIQTIKVTDSTLLSSQEIEAVIAPFKNTQLTLSGMQKVADLITDAYRQKGFITSRAYLPPQKIEKGVLEIKVIEGRMGEITVTGNRYVKAVRLASRVSLKKGEPFNYNTLRRDLMKINQNPDRFVRAVLMPGKEPGQTDLTMEVKDRLPIHIGFDADTYGSRYIRKQRYSLRYVHNDLLGLDDTLTFQYQLAQHSRYFLKSARYVVPLKAGWQAGVYALFSRVKLGEEFEDLDVRGKSKIYGVYTSNALLSRENVELSLNFGFDYKNVTNYQVQTVSSKDNIRVGKVGFDLDMTDTFGGRTLISAEMDIGIPDIMGGLKKDSSTTTASRSGSGGNFVKHTINLLRLQKLPFSSTLLWKNQLQISPYILTSVEEFQLGGIANVRGYPPAEAVGDRGLASTWEWTFPAYGMPRDIKVPFSKAMLYDALRFAMFYDWGTARLRRPAATEQKDRTLRAAGCGIRFTLPEDFSLRVDFGWPLDNTPTDSNHLHTWIQLSKSF